MLQSAPATAQQLSAIATMAAAMVQHQHRVGLGSGRAAEAFVQALGKRVSEEGLCIVGVPTSLRTEQLARDVGISIGSLQDVVRLDIAVDGADEIDPSLNLMKGGGGNLLREKVIARQADRLVIVAGGEKIVDYLGQRFPVFVEVVAFAAPVVTRLLTGIGAAVTLRRAADGNVFLTDNGNPLLHAKFTAPRTDLASVDALLHRTPGVIETGLFFNMASEALIAHADGRIEHRIQGAAPPIAG